jgi:hypothetical protein
VQQLLQDPALIGRVLASEPRLQGLLAANPDMFRLLAPERMEQVARLLRDPQQLDNTALLPQDTDLSMHRKVGEQH